LTVECADRATPKSRHGHLRNDLIEINRIQREKAKVSIMVAEVLMQRQDRLGVGETEAAQRYDASVEQSSCGGELRQPVTHHLSSEVFEVSAANYLANDAIPGP
jgi:hypothetical protein